MHLNTNLLATITLIGITFCNGADLLAQSTDKATDAANQQQTASVEVVANKAIEYLKTTGQNPEDGSFSESPAITALVTTGMLKHGVAIDDPAVAKPLEYLKTFVQPDGGIYVPEGVYKNYETSLAIVCFAEANKDGRYDEIIKNAITFAKSTQWGGEGRQVESSDHRYGGLGYGKHERPDMSNTSMGIDALKAGGVAEDSPEMQRALKFLTRSQNLYSEDNPVTPAARDKGGFNYTPTESKAAEAEGSGGLRSYGSMTYAGLKSMLYAGVTKDDARVRAAVDWLAMNYDLQKNPGMGDEGLFYYYHVFAKALDALGRDEFIDDQGAVHNWRQELLDVLAERQADDGSFTNKGSDRWLESDANLVTGYVLLALDYCNQNEEGSGSK